jgi:hypothetical protein
VIATNNARRTQQLYERKLIMAIAHGSAAIAMFAGLALALAAPTSAADPLSGHYTETETDSSGHKYNNDWYFTPCGDGCASVANTSGGQAWAQAQLANGKWTINGSSFEVSCPDGTKVPNAASEQYTWDPNALAGTAVITNSALACGNPAGYQQTNQMQLTQAS